MKSILMKAIVKSVRGTSLLMQNRIRDFTHQDDWANASSSERETSTNG